MENTLATRIDFSDPDEYDMFMELPHRILNKRFKNYSECEAKFEELKKEVFDGNELLTLAFVLFYTNSFNVSKYLESDLSEYLLEEIIDSFFLKYLNFGQNGFGYCLVVSNFAEYTICRFVLNFRQLFVDGFNQQFKSHLQYANNILLMFYLLIIYKFGICYNSTRLKISMHYFANKFVEARRSMKITKNDYLIVLSKIHYISKEVYDMIVEYESR